VLAQNREAAKLIAYFDRDRAFADLELDPDADTPRP
jgi:hypothetical protein